MSFVTKEWKDRIVEFAGRRKLTNVSTSAVEIVDVERNEGTVSQAGDAFSAANMNDLEERISNEFTNINENLTAIKNGLSNTFGESVTVPLNTNYICPSDGVVAASGYDANTCRCEVNGITVMVVGTSSGAMSVSQSWRVNKNDVVRFSQAVGSNVSKIGHVFRPCV